ncbi:MAG: hypothetical protein ACRDHP_20420 [Ktedonobacterales bacterium]
MASRRGWWYVGVLALLLAGCASGGSGAGNTRGTTPGATSTASAAVALTPSATAGSSSGFASPSSLGWKQVGAPQPDAVAFAPGAPNTIYTCTGATSSGASSVIRFSVSTDGGASWRTTNTPAKAGRCSALSMSPTDPQAIAYYAETCRQDCGESGQLLYYTLDSGTHWTQVVATTNGAVPLFAWLGTTLFASEAPANTPSSRTPYLAVSGNGGAFAWTSLPVAPQQLFTNGSTLYVLVGSSAVCSASSGCTDLYRSTDRGASWTHLTPSYNGFNVRVVASAPGSASPLLGFDARAFDGPNPYPVLRSTDSGASWQALPGAGANLHANTDPLLAPDGTVYCGFFDASGQGGEYKLSPGAASWALVSSVVPAQVNIVAVGWDTTGHPVALWGLAPSTDGTTSVLWTHPA